MRGVQTIVLDLAHIEDRLIAVWQALRHNRRLASHPVERKPIGSSAPEDGGEYVDVEARFSAMKSWRNSEAIVPTFIGRGAPFHAKARQNIPSLTAAAMRSSGPRWLRGRFAIQSQDHE